MFFCSQKHLGLGMNKFGVILAERSHPLAAIDLWPKDWPQVPLQNGNLNIKMEVEYEAIDAGYTFRWLSGGERVWIKPAKVQHAGT